ncbi:MAG: DMT family transporter [Brevirhabdus sp.]
MSPLMRAALWMTGAIVSFTSMAVAGRQIGADLDTFEIMMYRSLLGVLIVVSVLTARHDLSLIRARRMGLHLLRNLFHFTGQNLWFLALTLIPLAQVFALEFSSPLWVTLAAPLILGERLGGRRVAAVFLGFIGILIVARPDPAQLDPGILAGALAAIGFAGSAIFTKLLTRTETIASILFWLVVMQAVFGMIMAGYDGDIAWPRTDSWPWVGVIAVAGLVAHFSLTKALSLAPASVVVPIDFLRLPAIAVVGALFYAEPLDPMVLVGAVVIFAANYINILAASSEPNSSK